MALPLDDAFFCLLAFHNFSSCAVSHLIRMVVNNVRIMELWNYWSDAKTENERKKKTTIQTVSAIIFYENFG
jgi:hypothetical protein